MKLIFKLPLSVALSAAAFGGIAVAQDWYAGGQISWMKQSESDNRGQFTQDFTTGQGTTLPAGTALPSGTALGWNTDFDEGYGVSAEVGKRLKHGLRGGFEVAFSEANVDSHSGVTAGGTNIDGEDVALLTGAPTAAGATVGTVVGAGQGNVKNTAAFANVYYDFNRGGQIEPYVGAGIGASRVEVDYRPSGVAVGDDQSTKFAYQVKAGATYRINQQWEAFGEYTYRATDDVKVDLDLVPGNLKVENEQQHVGIGLRYRFGL